MSQPKAVKRKRSDAVATPEQAAQADAPSADKAQEPTPAIVADPGAGERKKKKKKTKKKASDTAEARVQLPAQHFEGANAEEAAALRGRLGISSSDPKSSTTRKLFQFNFAPAAAPADQPASSESLSAAPASPDAGPEADSGVTPRPAKDVKAADAQRGRKNVKTAAHAAADGEGEGATSSVPSCSRKAPSAAQPGAKADAPDGAEATDLGRDEQAAGGGGAQAYPPRARATAIVDAEGFVERRVYAGGMPFWYTEDEVRECWSTCGEIEDLKLLTFPDTGRFRGIAFVTFATQESFEAALEFNGDDLEGMTLAVKRCKAPEARVEQFPPPPDRPRRKLVSADDGEAPKRVEKAPQRTETAPKKTFEAPPGKVEGYNVAFVGNVAWEITAQALEDLFASFKPKFVRMFNDPATGKHRGFAHVHFNDGDAVDRAMAMDGTPLLGRKIKVMYAQPSAKHEETKRQRLEGKKAARRPKTGGGAAPAAGDEAPRAAAKRPGKSQKAGAVR